MAQATAAGMTPGFAAVARSHLTYLYGQVAAEPCLARLTERMAAFLRKAHVAAPDDREWVSQREAVLIAYGDMVNAPGMTPLASLASFLEAHVGQAISGVHVLPFFPSSSDDGFSVVDFRRVDPALGGWGDIEHLARRRHLMVDLVLNHVSAGSEWFRSFLRQQAPYRDWFIQIDPSIDLNQVVRPRTSPLLTAFRTPGGQVDLWTTFSSDQVDLNYGNPDVLVEMVDVLLEYVAHGACILRLDAIAYLWKEVGTPCIHLAQTHRVVQLLRAVLDEVAPHVKLVTETNVGQAENISYFGDGRNEAQWVYSFALPPLVLHALIKGSAAALTSWAASLELPSEHVTFFNFLASHDGIGLNAARGLLPEGEIQALVETVLRRGGLVSYKRNQDGSESPYELNVNYFDALTDPARPGAPDTQVDRFMASQSIMLSLRGVPGVYFHSLFGSSGWPEGVMRTGRKRTINRQRLDRAGLEAELAQTGSRRRQVLNRYLRLLTVRAASAAFHPHGGQQVLDAGGGALMLWRTSLDGESRVLCACSVRDEAQEIAVGGGPMVDLLTGERIPDRRTIRLMPYQTMWLRPDET